MTEAARRTVDGLGRIVQDASGQPPEEPKIDGRAATSPQNGRRGGRPPAPPAAQTAEEFVRDKLTMPDGYLVARHYRDSWYRFADGWHPISDGEMQKALATYMQDRKDLAGHVSTFYIRNVLINLDP